MRASERFIRRVFTAALLLFREARGFQVRTATFDMPEHGLTEEVLTDTDVLIFWSHALQDAFSDEVAERVQKHVLAGMGLIALHSAHFPK